MSVEVPLTTAGLSSSDGESTVGVVLVMADNLPLSGPSPLLSSFSFSLPSLAGTVSNGVTSRDHVTPPTTSVVTSRCSEP